MNIRDGTEKGLPCPQDTSVLYVPCQRMLHPAWQKDTGTPLVIFLLKSSALRGITFKYPALYQSIQAESQILVIFSKILPDLYSLLTSPEQEVEALLTSVTTHWFYKFPQRWQLCHKRVLYFCKRLLISNTCFFLASRIKGITACSCCCSTARRTRCKAKKSYKGEFSACLSLFTTEIINLFS
jgi:hypothetical protein